MSELEVLTRTSDYAMPFLSVQLLEPLLRDDLRVCHPRDAVEGSLVRFQMIQALREGLDRRDMLNGRLTACERGHRLRRQLIIFVEPIPFSERSLIGSGYDSKRDLI